MFQENPIANPVKPKQKRKAVPKCILEALKQAPRVKTKGSIRIFHEGQTFCPITWAYFLKTHEYMSVQCYYKAAQGIKISEWTASVIAHAADISSLCGAQLIRMRQELLEAASK